MPASNFQFVIDSHFQPFTLQEMLTPFLAYKDVYEKTEDAYAELSDKSNKFRYLSENLPEGSRARQIYEGYATTLEAQAKDLVRYGLSMGNRRALSSLKRRYSGEIGRLERADVALQEARKTREALMASGKDMIYAVDNFNIDDFLDDNRPDMFGISADELYARGAAAGKAASSRVFSVNGEQKTLGDYYIDFVQKRGYSREQIDSFLKNPDSMPELKQLADNVIASKVGNRLTGENLRRAEQNVIAGIVDGAIYEELHNPQRNYGKLTAYENAQIGLEQQRINLQRAQLAMAARSARSGGGGAGTGKGKSSGSSSKTNYNARNTDIIMVGAKSGKQYKLTGTDGNGLPLEDINSTTLRGAGYNNLIDRYGNISNAHLREVTGNNFDDYLITVIPKGSTEIDKSGFFDDDDLDEDVFIVSPKESKIAPSDFFGAFINNDVGR